MKGFKFGILLALIMAVSYILPADNGTKTKVDHKISYEQAIQYQENYKAALQAGNLKMPENGFIYDLQQMKALVSQEGGETFIVASGADNYNNYVNVFYVLDKNKNVLSTILEKGSCCPEPLDALKMAVR